MSIEIVTKEDLQTFEHKVRNDIEAIIAGQERIMQRLEQLNKPADNHVRINSGYIPALEYMRAVGIKRWKFDQLIADNKIRAVKKKRKIYVPVGEVERYFKDPNIR